jgi:hypothetical protein
VQKKEVDARIRIRSLEGTQCNMEKKIKSSIKVNTAKVSKGLTKKYSGKIIFKDKFEEVKTYFKDRDLESEVNKALSNLVTS